jgi:hypothetical protein
LFEQTKDKEGGLIDTLMAVCSIELKQKGLNRFLINFRYEKIVIKELNAIGCIVKRELVNGNIILKKPKI